MKKALNLLINSLAIVSMLTLTSCEKADNFKLNNKEKEKKIVLSKEKENIFDLNIYFASSKDNNSSELSKEERVLKKDEMLGETIINELIKGPSSKSNLKSILPKETRLLSFSIKDSIAYINLSKEANINMTDIQEELCIKSIIWSVTQISSVEKIKFLIENKDTDLWGGHFNLSKPIGKEDIEKVKNK